jgi:predicted transcriptional regulator/plasmid stabilization system protein ParE
MPKSVTIAARVDADLDHELERLAEATGRSKSWLINEALRSYVANEQQFLAAVEEGKQALRAGQVVDHATVVAAFERVVKPHPLRFAGPSRRTTISSASSHGLPPTIRRRLAGRAADMDTVQHLEDFPLLGRPGRSPGTRELMISHLPYLVVYSVDAADPQTVVILRVLHGARLWPPAAP